MKSFIDLSSSWGQAGASRGCQLTLGMRGSDSSAEPREAVGICEDAGGPDRLAFGLELPLPPRRGAGAAALGSLALERTAKLPCGGISVLQCPGQRCVWVGGGHPSLVAHVRLWTGWA